MSDGEPNTMEGVKLIDLATLPKYLEGKIDAAWLAACAERMRQKQEIGYLLPVETASHPGSLKGYVRNARVADEALLADLMVVSPGVCNLLRSGRYVGSSVFVPDYADPWIDVVVLLEKIPVTTEWQARQAFYAKRRGQT